MVGALVEATSHGDGAMTVKSNALTIVVRSADERTEGVCVSAIKSQSNAELHVVHERPFLAALRSSVRIGMTAGREFTLCVDADVILAPGAIARMIDLLTSAPDAFFAGGLLMDRYYGRPKSRGVHLYRTRFLAEAEKAITDSESVERPETEMKLVLLARGRTIRHVGDRLLGLHGFGQYYRDVFRTIACRGQKSPEEFQPLMERFSRGAGRDVDLRVALWALIESLDSDFSLDAGQWRGHFARIQEATGLVERGEMTPSESASLERLARLSAAPPISWWPFLRRFRRVGRTG